MAKIDSGSGVFVKEVLSGFVRYSSTPKRLTTVEVFVVGQADKFRTGQVIYGRVKISKKTCACVAHALL